MGSSVFAFSASEKGFNHIKANKVCEDASDFYEDGKTYICAVADGHGSDNYPRTDRGATCAVDAAISCILNFVDTVRTEDILKDEGHDYVILTQLAKSILNEWYESVYKDYAGHPFKPEELKNVSEKYRKRYLSDNPDVKKVEKAYGCTLIAYVVTEEYSFGLQIGDGRCVLIQENGTCIEPIPWDENCQLNITTSICDEDAIDEFRFFVSDKFPLAVFCGSDGIDDSYSNLNELYELYRSMLKIFADYGEDVGKKEIKEYLPVLTKKGSGDDVSVGLIIDLKKSKANRKKLDIQTGLFKAEEQLIQVEHKIEIANEMKAKSDPGSSGFLRLGEQLRSLRSNQKQLDADINDLHKQLTMDADSLIEVQDSAADNSNAEKSDRTVELSTALLVVNDKEKKYEIIVKGD